MAPPKKRGELSRSGSFYRKNKKARDKKKAYDTEFGKSPEQRKKRSELSTKRKRDKAAGKDIAGKDYDHGSDRYIDSSTNRGKKSGTPGDRRARGKRKGK